MLLDTNVFINAERGQFSHPKRILDLVVHGKVAAVITRSVRRENELLIQKLITDLHLQTDLKKFFSLAKEVKPAAVDIHIDDPEDYKLLQAAVGGRVNFLITDDQHLLAVGEYEEVRVVTPAQFWQWWEKHQDESGATWTNWAGQLFKK